VACYAAPARRRAEEFGLPAVLALSTKQGENADENCAGDLRRHGADGDGRAAGRRPGLSDEARSDDHSVSTRRQQRRRRPPGREWLDQQVFVDNRSGAGGLIGTEGCANAAPDGYTICLISIAHAVNPALYTLKYDPIKSFTPIAILATGPNVLAVNPELPVKTVADLIKLAKEKPGQLDYASAGVGSFQHLGGELFKLTAHVDLVHVPYKGGGPAMQDVIGGHVKIMFSSLIQTTPFIKTGQLRALGTGGLKRSPVLPDVPTIGETVPGYDAENWWGVVAPAGLPPPLVERLHKELAATLQAPELKAQFAREGAQTLDMSSAEFAKYIQTEIDKWGRVVKEGNIHAQ
jgi:tripartite-type tricarboxylate transporter receptor subunit TctC